MKHTHGVISYSGLKLFLKIHVYSMKVSTLFTHSYLECVSILSRQGII